MNDQARLSGQQLQAYERMISGSVAAAIENMKLRRLAMEMTLDAFKGGYIPQNSNLIDTANIIYMFLTAPVAEIKVMLE
jgi:hypothetical protein